MKCKVENSRITICQNCNEVVQFQNDDIKSYVSSLPGLEGRTCYHIICPCCHNSTSVSAPIDETY